MSYHNCFTTEKGLKRHLKCIFKQIYMYDHLHNLVYLMLILQTKPIGKKLTNAVKINCL